MPSAHSQHKGGGIRPPPQRGATAFGGHSPSRIPLWMSVWWLGGQQTRQKPSSPAKNKASPSKNRHVSRKLGMSVENLGPRTHGPMGPMSDFENYGPMGPLARTWGKVLAPMPRPWRTWLYIYRYMCVHIRAEPFRNPGTGSPNGPIGLIILKI